LKFIKRALPLIPIEHASGHFPVYRFLSFKPKIMNRRKRLFSKRKQ